MPTLVRWVVRTHQLPAPAPASLRGTASRVVSGAPGATTLAWAVTTFYPSADRGRAGDNKET